MLKILNQHREFNLHHLPHAPAPTYIGFRCSAETLASAAATVPADSWPEGTSEALAAAALHLWSLVWGEKLQCVSHAVSTASKARSSDHTVSTVLGQESPFRKKQMAWWLRHTASEFAASFPTQFGDSYVPHLFWPQIHKITILSIRKLQEQINLNVWDINIQWLLSYIVCRSEDKIFPGKSSILFMFSKKAKQFYTETQTSLPADVEPYIHTRNTYFHCQAGASRQTTFSSVMEASLKWLQSQCFPYTTGYSACSSFLHGGVHRWTESYPSKYICTFFLHPVFSRLQMRTKEQT